jgi:hypothetical protein
MLLPVVALRLRTFHDPISCSFVVACWAPKGATAPMKVTATSFLFALTPRFDWQRAGMRWPQIQPRYLSASALYKRVNYLTAHEKEMDWGLGWQLLAQTRSADRVRKRLMLGEDRTHGRHHETRRI